MNFPESLLYLQKLQGETGKFTIENIQKIVDRFPFDISRIRFIQVGGTNGKGSTTHFISSVLRASGFIVGRFTSPHLQDVRERIACNGRLISKRDFAFFLTKVRDLCEDLHEKGIIPGIPTFFEHLFLTALIYFQESGVDWGVLEVGLGGRLDATTTITPSVSVITNVAFDHMEILGNSLEKIAGEKAGIIRENTPFVCGSLPESNEFKLFEKTAEEKHAPFHPVFGSDTELRTQPKGNGHSCCYRMGKESTEFRVELPGKHQTVNAATAVCTALVLRGMGVQIPQRAISEGIEFTRIPGRIEVFAGTRRHPEVVLDGGHNCEGVRALTSWLAERPIKPRTLIFGVLRDKDYQTMAHLLLPYVETVVLTQPASHRALPPETLLRLFPGKKVVVEKKIYEAWKIAKKIKNDIIITGSLFLAGEMRTILSRRNAGE